MAKRRGRGSRVIAVTIEALLGLGCLAALTVGALSLGEPVAMVAAFATAAACLVGAMYLDRRLDRRADPKRHEFARRDEFLHLDALHDRDGVVRFLRVEDREGEVAYLVRQRGDRTAKRISFEPATGRVLARSPHGHRALELVEVHARRRRAASGRWPERGILTP